jgi:predicted ATPase
LGANPSKQSALFSLRDKKNNLAQAIHDFKQSKILKGEQEYEFVKYWMNEFEVGVDFEIKFYAGEAYEFYVFDKDGLKSHLADKGMGSLQAMMVILRVATILRKHKKHLKYITVIVEEPELNLHPALQSKLASFFHNVNKENEIEFIIETHSEYLIRKAQLFVNENEYTNQEGLNPNPFSVHYFDLDNGPYQMKFMDNGKFDRNFGEGFYDEASKHTMQLIQNNRSKS